MEKIRRCKGIYTEYNASVGRYEKHTFENGKFHQWGTSVTEFENGGAQETVAIVELEDGKVITTVPMCITFIREDLSAACLDLIKN